MKFLRPQLTKTELSFIAIILAVSVAIFAYYLTDHVSINYWDEIHFAELASKISNGNFFLEIPVRTYFYPTIISFFSLISMEDFSVEEIEGIPDYQVSGFVNTKILTSIFQYAVYLTTIVYIANFSVSRTKNKLIWYSIIGFGFLNPYLIQASVLFLSDILAVCFLTISILHLLTSDLSKIKNYSFVATLLFLAMMIKPSSSILIPVAISIVVFRFVKYRDFNAIKLGLICTCIAAIIIFPQLYTNIIYYDDWTPLIVHDLYSQQIQWAVDYLKYGTVIIPGEPASLYFHNPISVPESSTMLNLLFKNPSSFFFLFFSHIFGVIDWGYIETYIDNFYPASRILGSIFLYSTWFFIFYGITSFFRKKISHEKGKNVFCFLLIAFFIYIAFISTTAVESRFGYPSFLILLPFSGYGVHRFVLNTIKHHDSKARLLNKILFPTLLISSILVFFYLSFLLDLQTQRIDWFMFIDSQLN